MLLKNDNVNNGIVAGTLSSIISNLKEVDSSLAVETSKWLLKKSLYIKQNFCREPFPPVPAYMKRGDIVWVDFGINIGDELSDIDKEGHYAMIWAQQGFVFIVLPLTSDGKRMNDCAVDIGEIPELPLNGDSYIKTDMIRSVSIRRIRKIKGVQTGKITISDAQILNKIKLKLIEKLIF